MDPRPPLAAAAELNARLWINCLQGVPAEVAWQRPNTYTNSLGFVALHLLDARYFLAGYLGLSVENPFQASLADVQRIEDLPETAKVPLEALRAPWRALSEQLAEHVPDVEVAVLAAPSSVRFPTEDGSVLGGALFLLHHEAYHIGQMALLRKFWGLPAMRYDRRA
ncbi:MAG: DinB family protein [Rhodothermales bacterium]|nr:DinB family protein [Rhodothermales bacterium]